MIKMYIQMDNVLNNCLTEKFNWQSVSDENFSHKPVVIT